MAKPDDTSRSEPKMLSATPEDDRLLRAFMDNSPVVAWLKDALGRHVYLSTPYLEQIGVPNSDWFGKTDFDLWPEHIARRYRQEDRMVLETGERISFETHENVTRPDGQTRDWWITKFPVEDSFGNRYVGGIGVDITDRKHLEHERRLLARQIVEIANREQERLGQELHDSLGQQLTALQLFGESLKKQIDQIAKGAHDQRAIQSVSRLAERLTEGLALCQQSMRAVARGMLAVTGGSEGLVVSLQQLVESVRDSSAIDCTLDCRVVPLAIDSNTATHLFRITQESINNAVKHSGCRSIRITLDVQGQYGRLAIIDDGSGFEPPPDQRPIELRSSGIRIMRYRAELIGGSVAFKRLRSGGTEVRCDFPVAGSYRELRETGSPTATSRQES